MSFDLSVTVRQLVFVHFDSDTFDNPPGLPRAVIVLDTNRMRYSGMFFGNKGNLSGDRRFAVLSFQNTLAVLEVLRRHAAIQTEGMKTDGQGWANAGSLL